MASDDVAVSDVEWQARKDLHDRYAIDAVPLLVIADREGVVRRSFAGPVTATDLWAAVAAVRADADGDPPHREAPAWPGGRAPLRSGGSELGRRGEQLGCEPNPA